jgi:hypothetical protein
MLKMFKRNTSFEITNILEDQFAAKQKQFLDVFTFGMGNPENKET